MYDSTLMKYLPTQAESQCYPGMAGMTRGWGGKEEELLCNGCGVSLFGAMKNIGYIVMMAAQHCDCYYCY